MLWGLSIKTMSKTAGALKRCLAEHSRAVKQVMEMAETPLVALTYLSISASMRWIGALTFAGSQKRPAELRRSQ